MPLKIYRHRTWCSCDLPSTHRKKYLSPKDEDKPVIKFINNNKLNYGGLMRYI